MTKKLDRIYRIYRNEFAKRCFRDTADLDYISARTLFRYHCFDQFLFYAQQCIEKYLKATLLFSGEKYKSSSHNLVRPLKRCLELDFIDFDNETKKFIETLNKIEHTRYLAFPFYAKRSYLLDLDSAVSDIRKFCKSDIYRMKKVKANNDISLGKFNKGNVIFGGELERIIKGRKDRFKKLRDGLIWKNFFCGRARKTKIEFKFGYWGKYPPIFTVKGKERKRFYNAVRNYVYLPKEVHEHFRKWSEKEVKKLVDEAMDDFIHRDKYLLEIVANERTISHKLAECIQKRFRGWHVDCEYNRNREDPKELLDPEGKLKRVFPDIIIHKRKMDNNLLIIEMKKDANKKIRKKEKGRIRDFKKCYGYEYGLFVNLKTGKIPDIYLEWV